jgi:sugar phosphate isomerase/epimerase
MSKTIKGPAVFLAQFASDQAPFNDLPSITKWAAGLGFKGVQIPSWDKRFFDVAKAANSKDYCDQIKGICHESGLEITELSTHMQGQLVAVHPAYDILLDSVAPRELRNNYKARQEWAVSQMIAVAKASRNLKLDTIVSFSGALATPYIYPWPQRPANLIEGAFEELARRWRPILNAFDEQGVDVAYELNPGQDIFDGATYEMFLDYLDDHPRCTINYDPSQFLLQQLDYLAFIDIYHSRIRAFHVKDAEFNPTGRQGIYSGYQRWIDRAARFRSAGDGQVDFRGIFSKLTQCEYGGWAVLEWECAIKCAEEGAAQGARLIKSLIITATERAFDDYVGVKLDPADRDQILGLS